VIAKDSHSIAIKTLRQEQSLRDHGDAVEVDYALNPKFPGLIPRPLGQAGAGRDCPEMGLPRLLAAFHPQLQRLQMRAKEKPVNTKRTVASLSDIRRC
jgi:hypothetical protein